MEIYKGIGAGHCDHEDLIDFLNYVFGMNGVRQGFYRLLPKLYRPQYRPEDYNFIITENGKLRGAVGAYPIEMEVMGESLHAVGVGNVAVHPFHRGKGYMKDCMKMAMEDMVRKGADFAVLGGRRQRYSYFGFEPAGVCGKFLVDGANLRHAFGSADNDTGYTVRRVEADDSEALSSIRTMVERRPSHPVRPADRFFDVLINWESHVYLVLDPDGKAAGYFLTDDKEVKEVDCAAGEHAVGVLRACHAQLNQDELWLTVSEYAMEMFDLLADVAEISQRVHTENYNVFHYEKVVRVCLQLKAVTAPIADGVLTLNIDGYAGREKLRLCVRGGVPEVTPFEGDCDVQYTHRQAMGALFGLYASERRALPSCAQTWFPLPLFVPEVDND